MEETVTAQVKIHTLYYWCNDILATQNFYTNLLGLDEDYFRNDETMGWVTYKIANVDIVFMRATTTLPVYTEWAKQPGYQGGSLETPSFTLAVPPDQFEAIVDQLKVAEVPAFYETPLSTTPDNKQFFVQDPMGNTVEIYTEVNAM